ncbi:MAG: N-acetyl-gamma-glutamyl-phosphate reductase [Coriobacteriia bacterium]|nr:N-acetyl-gamma-glutamyl-phosphate reductase [Coriobacteriia bacterium]
MTDVAIIGAAGYAGIELTRLVLGHPRLRLNAVTSRGDAGARIDEVYPALSGLSDLRYEEPDVARIASRASVVFLAVPHTAALDLAPQLLAAGLSVVDASADYRLKDPEVYERWYGVPHTSPDLLPEAVYGLPEMDRTMLPGARLIACPGCYPTATLLAAAPALEAGIVADGPVIVDAKSGVSGAGRSASAATHYASVNESVGAYKVCAHRHTPEIEQGLSMLAGRRIAAVFAPHLVPLTRGLLSTVYLRLDRDITLSEAVELYQSRYAEEPFITVCGPGSMPTTAHVRGTNRAHIGVAVDPSGMLVATCVIDNLVKGTAGQAIQCANLALGFDETEGLTHPAPVI